MPSAAALIAPVPASAGAGASTPGGVQGAAEAFALAMAGVVESSGRRDLAGEGKAATADGAAKPGRLTGRLATHLAETTQWAETMTPAIVAAPVAIVPTPETVEATESASMDSDAPASESATPADAPVETPAPVVGLETPAIVAAPPPSAAIAGGVTIDEAPAAPPSPSAVATQGQAPGEPIVSDRAMQALTNDASEASMRVGAGKAVDAAPAPSTPSTFTKDVPSRAEAAAPSTLIQDKPKAQAAPQQAAAEPVVKAVAASVSATREPAQAPAAADAQPAPVSSDDAQAVKATLSVATAAEHQTPSPAPKVEVGAPGGLASRAAKAADDAASASPVANVEAEPIPVAADKPAPSPAPSVQIAAVLQRPAAPSVPGQVLATAAVTAQAAMDSDEADVASDSPAAAEPDGVASTDAQPASGPVVARPDAHPEPLRPLRDESPRLHARLAAGSSDASGGAARTEPVTQTTPTVAASGASALTDITPSAVTADAAPAPSPAVERLVDPLPASTELSPETARAAEATASVARDPLASSLSRATIETTANLAAQIARKLEGRSTRFDMVLTPEDLGRVDVTVEIDSDGQLAARLAFDNPAAAADLRGRADELRRQLQEAGFQVSNEALDFSQRDPSSGGGAFDRQQQRNALFAGGSRLAAQADLAAAPPPGAWTNHATTPDRVDVRV